MKLNISLSTESIAMAIAQLLEKKEEIEHGTEQLVEILTNEGAEIAQTSYGEWGVQATPLVDGTKGTIMVSGDYPAIAEFGAGDGVMSGLFENEPEEIRSGSYSEEHAQQYSKYGFWYFGGQRYTEVPGRHGLYNAKQYIIDNSTDIAQEVFGE